MTRRLSKNVVFLILVTCFFTISSAAQSVTGIWRGYFISDDGSQYKLEFQVKQTNSGSFATTGVSYSYANDKRFYGKATMTGNFIKSSSNFRIREIKTVEVKNLSGGSTCIMNYDLSYSRSGKEEFLEGTYLGKPETEKENLYEWGDCGGGKVFLRKVVESDFYVEPFLRPSAPKKTASPPPATAKPVTPKTSAPVVTKRPPPKAIPSTPVKKDPPANTVKKPVTENPPVKKETGTVKRADTLVTAPGVTAKAPVKVPSNITSVFRSRQNELMKLLVVNSPKVEIKIYDNGEIDDDTISVYFDKKLVLSNKRLTAAALTIHVDLDDESQDHELVLVAENLGRIPPNTSLMVVEAGDKVFNVRITSTDQKNAVVRFRYEKQ